MRAAIAMAARARGLTSPNPAVGCLIVRNGVTVGTGWTQHGGRPHAEAVALDAAGSRAGGADIYVTLEPCAHDSRRGPACADLLIAAKPARVIAALKDPDPRTAGKGFARLRAAGIEVVEGLCAELAAREHAGFLVRQREGRPRITLKLAVSIDGRAALASGESQWITGPAARTHAHLIRAESDLILVGRGTLEADDPALDVRIAGLQHRSPRPAIISATLGEIPVTAKISARDPLLLRSAQDLFGQPYNDILVEGGAGLAGSLIRDDLVDRLLIYRAPILIGDRAPGIGDIGLADLSAAHGRWALRTTRRLGADTLEIYARI
ncbi:bifunctional diaminohydroxyphosphoribosylaminopyrimidine deaminase/5-amino-6-(5-phosphoribosylamino)uracil reductase RibD [Pacificimonas sp. WHA3]|uniref:Riboflavin biosynthesis protein RibD n=2 Tax=Pacificimonas pallii TaxID=2827236 RepID=A0ABS6SCR8_9SPHN|nr:bifunctional diaminohydroxyphosphoribosylaminopyrimidine deaminase/5-amino-6-(5-phosphoribosylamino)uracil reductase RibD [Pacificimonas pallii]